MAGFSSTYFRDCEQVEPSATGQDDELAERVWPEGERLTGVEWLDC